MPGREKEQPLDPVIEEELTGDAPASSVRKPGASDPGKRKNAFSELMSPKEKPAPPVPQSPPHAFSTTQSQRALNSTQGRDALAAYTTNPTFFPTHRVISHDENFVVINDLYPKSSIHLLLLPRDPQKQLLHPFDALDGSDPAFCAQVKAKVAELRVLAASELRRRFGACSISEAPRLRALESDDLGPCEGDDGGADAELPPGRDWSKSIISGVHAHPSMNHLHIHILSVDRHSECMRHRKHYNSFATPFLVPVEELPLAGDDVRRRPGREGFLERELVCWRCGGSFGRGFKRLKEHLGEEFEAWKRE